MLKGAVATPGAVGWAVFGLVRLVSALILRTGIHAVPHPSWSRMVTFLIETPLSFAALEQCINRQYLEGVVGIDEDSAGDWIVAPLCRSGELLADGVATLLSALPHPAFLEAQGDSGDSQGGWCRSLRSGSRRQIRGGNAW